MKYLKKFFDNIRPMKILVKKNLNSSSHLFKGTALDYGCGRKPFKQILETFFYKVDYVDVNKHDSSTKLFIDNKIPDIDYKYDCIFAFDVLQHVPDISLSLKDIKANLNDSGYVFFTVPYIYPECDFDDYRRWTFHGIQKLMIDNNFKEISITRRGGILECYSLNIMQNFFNIIVGKRFDWSIQSKFKSSLLVLIEIILIPFIYIFRALDNILNLKTNSFTMGWIVLARKS